MKWRVFYNCHNLMIGHNDQTIWVSKCWHTEFLTSNGIVTPPISYNYFGVYCAKKQLYEKDSSLVVRILIKELNHLLLFLVSINCYLFVWIKALLRSESERREFWSTLWSDWSGLLGSRGLSFKEVEYGSVAFGWMPKALDCCVKEGCSFSSSVNLVRKGEKVASKLW